MAKKIGLCLASLHVFLVVAMILFVNRSTDPQASLLWVFFAIADFPISLIILFSGNAYSEWLNGFKQSVIVHILYLPYLVHGVVGTIWWYYLPRFFTSKKFGGVWGRTSGVRPNRK